MPRPLIMPMSRPVPRPVHRLAPRPLIDLSDCVRCEVCVDVSPSVFYVNEAGTISVAERDEYPGEEVAEAIRSCPKDCIYLEE